MLLKNLKPEENLLSILENATEEELVCSFVKSAQELSPQSISLVQEELKTLLQELPEKQKQKATGAAQRLFVVQQVAMEAPLRFGIAP